MPKVKISEYSATANSNTDVASINIDEGCAPSGINNAIRAVMGHLKDFQQGTYGDPFNGPVNGTLGATTASTAVVTTLNSTDATDASSTTAAAMKTAGGLGVAKKMFVGLDANIYGLTVGRGAGAVATNTAVGASALALNTSGSGITAIGYQVLYANTTGVANTAVGGADGVNSIPAALTSNSTGSYNVGVGTGALKSNTTASNNTAVGYQAGYANTTGAENSILGYLAGYGNTTGSQNTFIGRSAGVTNQTGAEIVAVGFSAMGNCGTVANYNTAVGRAALNNVTGTLNVGLGNGSGSAITSGSKNTILGSYSGNQGGLDIRTASNYIVLSDGDGNPRLYNAGSYFWSLVGTSASTCGAILFRNSSQTQYWNMEAADTNWYVFGTSTYVYFAQGGSSWVFSSDRRIKENIVDIDYGLNAVMQLKPRRYDNTTNEKNEIGFVAQELREVIPEAVTGEEIEFDENDTKMERAKKSLGVSKDTLIPVLVKAIQEQQAIITSQAADIEALKAKVGL